MPVAERTNLDSLRAEVQRKLAAQIDLGTPDPEPPRPERVERSTPPRTERPRIETLRFEARRNTSMAPDQGRIARLFSRFGHLRIKPSRLALLVVAVGAGGMAAYLATHTGAPAPAPAPRPAVAATPAPAPIARTRIMVAKTAIGVGQRLTPDLVEWADWPTSELRPEYIIDTPPTGPATAAKAPPVATTGPAEPVATATTPPTPASPAPTATAASVIGSVARFQLFAGEPIRADKLAPVGSGFLSAILDKGMRAVSVSVAAEAASGGFITPNDHVDVVLSRNVGASHDAATILSNVRVLAINAKLGESGAQARPPEGAAGTTNGTAADVFTGQAVATLELDPTQAVVITDATAIGKLTLVLRSSTDEADAGRAAERAANAAIRLSSPFWAASAPTSTQPAR